MQSCVECHKAMAVDDEYYLSSGCPYCRGCTRAFDDILRGARRTLRNVMAGAMMADDSAARLLSSELMRAMPQNRRA